MDRDLRRRLASLQRDQHGVVSRRQARDVGVSRDAIESLVRTGQWDRPAPAVYRETSAPRTPRQRLWIAVLWAGDRATLSHGTAAALWHLDGVGRSVGRPDLWVPNARAPRTAMATVHRTLVLPDVDRASVDGLPVTSPERTIIDLAGVVGEPALEAAFESARRSDLVTIGSLAERAIELCTRGRRGATRVWRLLRRFDGDHRAVESVLEVHVLRSLRRANLPLPRPQHDVRVGGRRFRLDFAWPERRVAVECHGWRFHRDRRRFDQDQERTALLVAAGWRIVPTTWSTVTSTPDELVRTVAATLAEAGARP